MFWPPQPQPRVCTAACLLAEGRRFCCPGCAAAYETIQTLGLGRYYAQRILDPTLRALRPEPAERRDLSRFIATRSDGTHELVLAIDGLQCGACVWLIESVLAGEPDVLTGRVNMTTRRLRLVWRGAADRAMSLVDAIERLGYRLVPFDAASLAAAADSTDRALMRALAVAGFAAGNVMLLSIGIWAGEVGGLLHDMGPATRDLLHWFSALIAMPAIAYAGMPFFTSAAAALRQMRTNMDVPISLGVDAGHRHEPRADHAGRGSYLLRFSNHAAVLPADRPRAGPSRPRPGARHRRAVADVACL